MKKLMVVLAPAFVLCACQGLVTRDGLREQEQKKEIVERVSTLQKSSADVNNRFADIESDLRESHGRIEVVENRLAQQASASEKSRKNADEQLAEAQKKIGIMQDEIAKMQDQISALAGELANVKTAAAAPVAGVTEKSDGKGENGAYDVAEELFDKKEWRKAILNYQKFREAKPKHKKVPEAIYKICVCFQELGMKDEAKTFYDEVISKYAGSVEAKKAKIRLKKLK
jgi:TolA-binding protein